MSGFFKALLALLAVGALVSLYLLFGSDRPVGSENLVGKPLPGFAAPLSSGTLDGDSNIYTEPQARAARSTAACDVHLADTFNSCGAFMKGESIVAFWNTTKDACIDAMGTLDEFAEQNPEVNVVAVAFDKPKKDVAAVVQAEKWRMPVAVDRDGATAALYATAGCPSYFFAEDGRITGVKLGVLSADQLAAGVALDGATGASGS